MTLCEQSDSELRFAHSNHLHEVRFDTPLRIPHSAWIACNLYVNATHINLSLSAHGECMSLSYSHTVSVSVPLLRPQDKKLVAAVMKLSPVIKNLKTHEKAGLANFFLLNSNKII